MKRLATLLSLVALTTLTAIAQVGTWKAYISYNEPQQIAKGGDKLYVRASNSLYYYNLADHSITTFDKVRQLNDCKVNAIAWNPTVGRLIVVYENGNIDLIDANDNVVNISALYSKVMMQDKTVNNVFIHQQYAYLATAFGIVKVNMQRAEISESYILNQNITNVEVKGDSLYAKIVDTWTENNGTPVIPYQYDGDIIDFYNNWNKTHTVNTAISGALNDNLIDPHNWKLLDNVPAGMFSEDLSDWNDNIELVRTLNPGGPKNNNFAFMRLKNKKLYTVGGGYAAGTELNRPATVQVLDTKDDEWIFLQDDVKGKYAGTEAGNWQFIDMLTVDVDPLDENHVFAGGRTGLYEYYGEELKNYWNKDNSLLQSATSSNRYVIIAGMCFDKEGNLWMLQTGTPDNSLVELTKDGEWKSLPHQELMNTQSSLFGLSRITEDSRGLLWFINAHWETPAFFSYDPSTDQIIINHRAFRNQDGINYSSYNPHDITEDLDGNMWLSTMDGPFMLEAANVNDNDAYLTQVKVPRNDGTNYADYLLSGVNIRSMVIDGGNRKWVATTTNGVYVISADNMTQVAHFTTSNSPLLSDRIESIAIDNETGEVFIGTENGLCSYMSDATNAVESMEKDNVWAYPNPVVRGYDGLITVVGLSFDADVKILSASGQLVAQGRSNGGTFTWNGRDRSGKRVASGIYMVAAATSDGKKGTVCKIAIIN